jgi:hypothetical protein
MTYVNGQSGIDFADGTSRLTGNASPVELSTRTFDDTITTSSVADSGGTWDRQIDIGIIKSGIFQLVEVDIDSGTSADTDIELYDGDPTGAGVLIYQSVGLDIVSNGKYSDPNIWWGEVQATGDLRARITNNGASATTYTLRIRIRDDNTTVFTE